MYYAVVKNIEIIGEASNLLTEEFKAGHHQTPWNVNLTLNCIINPRFLL